MSALLLACGWVAGVVLLAGGVLKAVDLGAFRRSLPTLRLPGDRLLVRWAAAVPAAEIVLGLGVLFLTGTAYRVWLVGACLMYAAFLVVVVRAVALRLSATCACFGTLGPAGIGWRTVVRNVALLLVALAGLAAPSAGGRLAGALALAVVAALAALAVVRERRRRQREIDSLVLFDVDGAAMPLREFQDPPTILVFFSPGCGACRHLVSDFRWWPHALADGLDLQPVFIGTPESFEGIEVFAPLAPHAWYDHDRVVFQRLGGDATPSGIRVDRTHPLGDTWHVGAAGLPRLVFRPGFDRNAAARATASASQDAPEDHLT